MPSPRVRRRHLRRGRGARGRRPGAGRGRERLGGGGFGGDDLELPRGAELAADRGGNGRHGEAVGVSLPPLPPSAASCRRSLPKSAERTSPALATCSTPGRIGSPTRPWKPSGVL